MPLSCYREKKSFMTTPSR